MLRCRVLRRGARRCKKKKRKEQRKRTQRVSSMPQLTAFSSASVAPVEPPRQFQSLCVPSRTFLIVPIGILSSLSLTLPLPSFTVARVYWRASNCQGRRDKGHLCRRNTAGRTLREGKIAITRPASDGRYLSENAAVENSFSTRVVRAPVLVTEAACSRHIQPSSLITTTTRHRGEEGCP